MSGTPRILKPGELMALIEWHQYPPGKRRYVDNTVWDKRLYELGFLAQHGAEQELTPLGRAHLEQLLCLPLPQHAWLSAVDAKPITWAEGS